MRGREMQKHMNSEAQKDKDTKAQRHKITYNDETQKKCSQ